MLNEDNFQHILRVLNTNIDGKIKVMFALTSIKGVGRRIANIICKKAEVDLTNRCAPAPALLASLCWNAAGGAAALRWRRAGARQPRRRCRTPGSRCCPPPPSSLAGRAS